jgi:F-type H+-transporting ATPase subunit a
MEGLQDVLLMDAFIKPEVVPHFVSYGILTSILLVVGALILRGSLRLVPRGIQNFIELIINEMLNLVDENIGEHWGPRLFPFICTIFIYILVCNLMGLLPGFTAATANVNTNAAMAIPVFFATHYFGIRAHGIKYINHFLGPIRSIAAFPLMLLMFAIEVIGHFARPLTLTVRLFGNMIAKHILLIVLAILAPWIVPVSILALGLLVSVVQALVFTLLSTLYLAGAVEEAH